MKTGKTATLTLAIFFSAVFAAVYLATAQPVPCSVFGNVSYDSGTSADESTYCHIYNASSDLLCNASCDSSGYYQCTVGIYSYADVLTVECTDDTYDGSNSGNCSNPVGGQANINVTLIVSEYADVGVVPGYVIPVLIITGFSFIKLKPCKST